MSLNIDDLIGRVKMPVRSVTICLDGDLQAEHDALTEQLELVRRGNPATMGGTTEGKEIADRIGVMRAGRLVLRIDAKTVSAQQLEALYLAEMGSAGPMTE